MSSELRSLEERSRSVVWRYGTNAKFTLCRCCRLFSKRGQAPNCIFVSFTSVLQHDKLHKLYTIHQDCIGAKNRPQQLQLKHPAEDKKHSSHHFPNPLCLEIIVTGYVSLFFSSAVIWNLASRHCFGRTSPLKWVPVHSHAKKKGCRCDRLHQGVGKRMCRTCKKEKKKPQTNWAHKVSAYTTEWSVRTRLVFHSHPCRIMWVKASEKWKMNECCTRLCLLSGLVSLWFCAAHTENEMQSGNIRVMLRSPTESDVQHLSGRPRDEWHSLFCFVISGFGRGWKQPVCHHMGPQHKCVLLLIDICHYWTHNKLHSTALEIIPTITF